MSQIGELVISALGPPGKPLVAALEEVSSRLPPITGEGHAMRIQEPDKRLSWGLAVSGGRKVVRIFVER